MKVMVIGGGGREHALVWKLSQSPRISSILCAPGNGGISTLASCLNLSTKDLDGLCAAAVSEHVDFVVVAPDDPLALGLVNRLEALGIPAFGPRREAAEIESSKVFAKNFMKKYRIPTAEYAVFSDAEDAVAHIRAHGAPIVVKADGLALGKGVTVCETPEAAEQAVRSMLLEGRFGQAGASIVLEERMTGPEVTVLCFADGKTLLPMPSSQDHKRAFDGDSGPNTGGMGAISPSPYYTPEIEARCMEEIFLPTLRGLEQEGRPFKGVLYFGLMLTPDGPKVIEYNARFGDPETQALLARLDSDLFELLEASVNGTLNQCRVQWSPKASCCVVLASGGYPDTYETGFPITGLDRAEGLVFHAGTKYVEGVFQTAGGRVLGVTALGDTLPEAIVAAYRAADAISFERIHYRHDIGKIFLGRDSM